MKRESQEAKAVSFWKQGDLAAAISIFTQLADTYPGDPELWGKLGVLHAMLGEIDLSIECYKKTLILAPNSENAHLGIAMAYGLSGRRVKAQFHFSAALLINPNNIEASVKLAVLEFYGGNITEALRLLKRAESINPNHLELNVRFAEIYTALNDPDKAATYLQKADRIQPNNPEVILRLASRYVDLGEAEQAYVLIKPLLDRSTPFIGAAILLSEFCIRIGCCAEALDALQKILISGIQGDDEMRVCFSIGKLLDRKKEYKKAFTFFKRANDLYDKPYDYSSDKEWLSTIQTKLRQNTYIPTQKANPGLKTEIQPIFIVGMPRSGTSLTEQILSSHPQVHGAGERMEINDAADTIARFVGSSIPYPDSITRIPRSTLNRLSREYIEKASAGATTDAIFFTDKMPHNFRHLGLIQLLFPQAKIVHCTRSALDTCLSNYFTLFRGAHEYSYKLESIAQMYLIYTDTMQHWRNCLDLDILDFRYEELITSPEQAIRKLLDFCGLNWSENCLSFYANKRAVITISRDQVRQPLYSGSINRWKNYEQEITLLIKLLTPHLDPEFL